LAKEGHPLQKAAHELTVRLHHEIKDNQWLKESDPQEHPLREIGTGTMIASAKMAGALNRFEDEPDDWPPDELSAGDILVRLKKAREALKDALAGLDAADEQQLGHRRMAILYPGGHSFYTLGSGTTYRGSEGELGGERVIY
jgi:hypothetical protein